MQRQESQNMQRDHEMWSPYKGSGLIFVSPSLPLPAQPPTDGLCLLPGHRCAFPSAPWRSTQEEDGHGQDPADLGAPGMGDPLLIPHAQGDTSLISQVPGADPPPGTFVSSCPGSGPPAGSQLQPGSREMGWKSKGP